MILFNGEEHERRYKEIIGQMKKEDCYHKSLAYLLALNNDTYNHVNQLFNFEDDGIIRDGLLDGWQTSGSLAVTRMAFNLWNGLCSDDDESNNAYRYTPYNLFCYTSLAPYFYEAALIRFEVIE